MPATDILHLATLQLRIILKCPVGEAISDKKGGEGRLNDPALIRDVFCAMMICSWF